ncbi:MAG: acyltransferase [Pseudomonadota bacterium]|nr:acyltransferase [Pseudomonadota bacterium]
MIDTPAKRAGIYRPELDILRFVAFMMVFSYHVLPSATGQGSFFHHLLLPLRDAGAFGVPVFFALSSFLITDLLVREIEATGEIHFKAFYVRRTLRIWPLYFLIIAITSLCLYFFPVYDTTPGRLVAFIFFVGNVYVGSYGFGHDPLVPLWSLSIEEQYYLLWPQVIKRFGVGGLVRLSAVAIMISYAVLIYLGLRKVDLNVLWPNSLVQMQFLAAGSILAVLHRGRIPRRGGVGRALQVGSSFLLFFLSDLLVQIKTPNFTASAFSPLGYLMVLMGTILLLHGVLGTAVPRWAKPLVYLGKISYGLYMFHFIAIDIVTRLESDAHFSPVIATALRGCIALPVTILAAALSYRFFETPFLRLKERFTFVTSRPIA